MRYYFMSAFCALTLVGMGANKIQRAFAEETTGEHVAADGRKAKTKVKKKTRKLKKKLRDATGNSSTKEDIKDTYHNVKDDASDTAKETKDKVD